ncbi:MAG: N-6 DNA methylase [Lachnospiraceae bacterium]|nr:N-6 DNA methylase [Lachnospiraceae bacterium]
MIDLYMICTDLKNAHSNFRQKSNSIILDIYKILNNSTKKTERIVEGWKSDFRYIYGDVEANLSSNNKLDINEILERYYIVPNVGGTVEQTQLLFFSIQTYFSVLIKVMMKEILFEDSNTTRIEDVILGKFAIDYGINNYCYPDWYSWPVFEAENGFEEVLKEIQESVSAYRSFISLTDFSKYNNYDYIKQMYEAVIPKELRHALGEYYTPDWLAEETLSTVLSFEETNIKQRFIDPTCGSGTFIFKTIYEKRKAGSGLKEILNSVSGIDINPLAVLTAKTNYLLAVIDLLDKNEKIDIPVYNTDIVKFEEISASEPLLDFITAEEPEKEIRKYAAKDRAGAFSQEKADIIVGNPPWVNWEYMPEEYRRGSQHLWIDYNLFSAKGRDLSFSKEDISVLITYIVMDKLLKKDGILAFVIRQGVFKSAQNGVGFRSFKLKNECGIKVLRADDLSKIRAFDNATNSTALIYLKKGEDTCYPVPYVLWEKRKDLKKLSFNRYSELREVKSQVTPAYQKAMPAVDNDLTSIWLTADEKELESMIRVLGKNDYKARTGIFTGGANAVYWLEINKKDNGKIEISNIVKKAKRKSEKITRLIEPDFVFPMLKGSNVRKWNITYDTYLLCPHTAETKMWPVSQTVLQEEVPETYEYLHYFKKDLDGRKGFAGWEKEIQKQEFHAILRIGEYTFSKYKVIWKYIASEFVCAVISSVDDSYLGNKMILPNEKIMYVSLDDEDEAYYLCGVLSSTLIASCVKSYMNPTSISAHVLDKLNIPDFDRNNEDHMSIARECKEGHGRKDIDEYIERIDLIVSKMYQ